MIFPRTVKKFIHSCCRLYNCALIRMSKTIHAASAYVKISFSDA